MMVMPPLAIAGELRMSHAGKCVWVHNSRLFVSLDFTLYVTPEGFEPSRHNLDPGWQHQGITPVPPDATCAALDLTENE